MLGFAPSVTRAVIMNSVLLLATVFRREYDSPTALGLALLVLLLGNPFAIASVGLQLSFASVAGILTFTPPICRWLRGLFQKTMKKNRFLNGLIAFFITSGATTFGASLLTLPLSALYFDTISLISVVSNLVLLPVISGIFTLGYPLVLLSWGFYPVAHLGAWLLSYPIRFSLWGVELLARMPYAALYSRSAYALLWLGASYLLLAVAWKFRKPFTGILLSLGMLITVPFLQGIDRADFRFSMLDVGQGQCLLAQFHGNTFVIDCGGTQGEGAGEEAARELLSRGRSRIDGLVLTHFDMDHTGGVVQLMDRVEVGCLYLPDVTPEDSQRALILRKAEEKEIPIQWVREDIILRPDSGKVEIFAPFGTKNQNMGLCLLLSAHDCDILVTGDISIQEERQLLLMKRIPDLEILVAGHHGSRDSTGYRLLDYTKPEVLLISVGANAYGHPSPEVLERGDAFHIPIRRTDQEGTITITR
jgi:competence protein ComEC